MSQRHEKAKKHVGYDFALGVQKALQAATQAFANEMAKHKPDNPRSPSYQEDYAEWQRAYDVSYNEIIALVNKHARDTTGPNQSNNAKDTLKALTKVNDKADKVKEQNDAINKLNNQAPATHKGDPNSPRHPKNRGK